MRKVILIAAAAVLCATAQVPSAHVGAAVRLMQDRRYVEAAAQFEQALAADPGNDQVRIQYATCLFAAEKNEEARRQFEIEKRRTGDRPGLEYYLGILDQRAGNNGAAIRELKPLESNTAFPKAAYYLGLAYLAQGQADAGQESLERASRNNLRDPEVHYRLARSYSAAGKQREADREYAQYRSARDMQRIVEEEAPKCMDALHSQPIARAREICGRLADPKDSKRLTFLGQLYVQSGFYAEAVGPLGQASRLDPDSFEAWNYLGLSHYGLKQYKEALPALQKATALNPGYFDTLNLLAKTYYILGDYQNALPVLERAHQLNPGDTQLAGVLDRLRASSGKKQ